MRAANAWWRWPAGAGAMRLAVAPGIVAHTLAFVGVLALV